MDVQGLSVKYGPEDSKTDVHDDDDDDEGISAAIQRLKLLKYSHLSFLLFGDFSY